MKIKIFKENRISKHYKTVAILLFSRDLRRKTSENGKKLLHGKHFFCGAFLGKKQGVKRRSRGFDRCGLRCRGVARRCRLSLPQRRFAWCICGLCKADILALLVSFCVLSQRHFAAHACELCKAGVLLCLRRCVLQFCLSVVLTFCTGRADFCCAVGILELFFYSLRGKLLVLVKCGRLAFTVLRKCCR